MAANVKVTQRMLGARSTAATAVGSRPKLNTIRTRTVKTAAERIAVRERNSMSKSLRARRQACRSVSATRDRLPVCGGDPIDAASRPRLEPHEPARAHERHVRRQLGSFFDVVR